MFIKDQIALDAALESGAIEQWVIGELKYRGITGGTCPGTFAHIAAGLHALGTAVLGTDCASAGGFITTVLEDSLLMAAATADRINCNYIFLYPIFKYNCLPAYTKNREIERIGQ